jgi:hypothetical protein
MTNDPVSSGFTAAEAAYVAWQQQVNVRVVPLSEQAPETQARWLRIAESARSAPATDKCGDTDPGLPHTMTQFQAPPEPMDTKATR